MNHIDLQARVETHAPGTSTRSKSKMSGTVFWHLERKNGSSKATQCSSLGNGMRAANTAMSSQKASRPMTARVLRSFVVNADRKREEPHQPVCQRRSASRAIKQYQRTCVRQKATETWIKQLILHTRCTPTQVSMRSF